MGVVPKERRQASLNFALSISSYRTKHWGHEQHAGDACEAEAVDAVLLGRVNRLEDSSSGEMQRPQSTNGGWRGGTAAPLPEALSQCLGTGSAECLVLAVVKERGSPRLLAKRSAKHAIAAVLTDLAVFESRLPALAASVPRSRCRLSLADAMCTVGL